MKPRTKRERELVEKAGMLPPLPGKAKRWAQRLFDRDGYYLRKKRQVWCQCCGDIRKTTESELSLHAIGYVCPACHKKLSIHPYTDPTTYRVIGTGGVGKWVSVAQVREGYQVIRTFDVTRSNEMGKPTRWGYDEVFQNWIAPDGRETIVSKPYTRSCFSGPTFHPYEPWGIAQHNASYAFEDMFDPATNCWLWPDSVEVAPFMVRAGISVNFMTECFRSQLSLLDALRKLNADPYNETILKTGQVALFVYMLKHTSANPMRHAVNICNRNGYVIKDPGMWLDYVQQLEILGLDTHNAHYVCPPDLKKAHQQTQKRYNKLSNEDRQKGIAASWEEEYLAAKGRYFSLDFNDDSVRVYTAPSVEEIRKEAKRMGHCVFSNGYYKRQESLIMLAVDCQTGKHLETVEVNLSRFEVAQSRGYGNKPTPAHAAIVRLVNSKMGEIRRIKTTIKSA